MSCPECFYPAKHHAGGCPNAHYPDPVECRDCECGDEPCVWYGPDHMLGGGIGFHGYHEEGQLKPCRRCEGSGEYSPEIEEDVPEPDEDDPREER